MKTDLANSWIMMAIVPNVVTGYFVDKVKKVTSIADVNTVEDFCYWRGLRAANVSAAQH